MLIKALKGEAQVPWEIQTLIEGRKLASYIVKMFVFIIFSEKGIVQLIG